MEILSVKDVNKKIGKRQILKDVSLSLNDGDIMALIGPNGAGKTTLIKCILGLQKMNSGSVTINGFNIKKDFVKAIERVGCIVEAPDHYMYLSGYDNLKLQANMYPNVLNDDIGRVVELVGLEDRIHDAVGKYSLGMRQRLGIAASLLQSPNLLVLDEPTNGLDPEGIKDLRILLKRLAKSGVAIMVSSHNLSELESFCTKVCILSQGQILEESSIKEIKEMDENKYVLKVRVAKDCGKYLQEQDRIIDKEHIEVIRDEGEIAEFIRLLVKNSIDIFEVKKEVMSLEEAFIKKSGGKTNDSIGEE